MRAALLLAALVAGCGPSPAERSAEIDRAIANIRAEMHDLQVTAIQQAAADSAARRDLPPEAAEPMRAAQRADRASSAAALASMRSRIAELERERRNLLHR